jgi:hypothetical protein
MLFYFKGDVKTLLRDETAGKSHLGDSHTRGDFGDMQWGCTPPHASMPLFE